MSSATSSDDSFAATAGRQLALYAALALTAFILLMMALSWASSRTGTAAGSGDAVDPASGTITLALATEPPQLNSSLATDTVSGMILGHVQEGLLRYDEHNRIVPGVAESWEIREDGATFRLRDSARWSDGKPVTAHDFVFAWRTALDPANASEYAFILYPVKNAEAINRGDLPVEALGVRARSDIILEVEFERSLAYFDKLTSFSTFLPIREDFHDAMNGAYGADADKMLYNGPFVISRWVHGASLRMERNPHYWNPDRAKLNAIDFAYITSDTNATLNLFKDGKIAYTGLLAENLEDAMQQRWSIHRFMDGSVFYIEFNHRPGRVTGNHHLRKALQLATDSSELVYKVTKLPGYLPGESLFPVWLKGMNGFFREEYPANYPRMNLEKARRHLELAKQELGVDEIPPLVLLSGDNPLSSLQSEYYQQVYRKHLGLTLKIDKQIFKQRLAKMLSGDFDMVLAGWGPDYDDPLTFADLYASWNQNNRGRYSNPELDEWVRIAQQEQDQARRMQAFAAIQRILIDDAVIVPSYERGVTYVTHPRLHGMVRRTVGADPDFSGAWIGE